MKIVFWVHPEPSEEAYPSLAPCMLKNLIFFLGWLLTSCENELLYKQMKVREARIVKPERKLYSFRPSNFPRQAKPKPDQGRWVPCGIETATEKFWIIIQHIIIWIHACIATPSNEKTENSDDQKVFCVEKVADNGKLFCAVAWHWWGQCFCFFLRNILICTSF